MNEDNGRGPIDAYRIDLPNVWRVVSSEPEEFREALALRPDVEAALTRAGKRQLEAFRQRLEADLHASNTSFVAFFAEMVGGKTRNLPAQKSLPVD